MLRFLSRRRNRNPRPEESTIRSPQIKSQRIPVNKNLIQCRIILLDNTDLSVDLSVSYPVGTSAFTTSEAP
uniref:Uncharacterized protein n=1 Tax=Lutzomyia longipalpis TaxID=7200 RepID=A0A1B0CW42_LUTLO